MCQTRSIHRPQNGSLPRPIVVIVENWKLPPSFPPAPPLALISGFPYGFGSIRIAGQWNFFKQIDAMLKHFGSKFQKKLIMLIIPSAIPCFSLLFFPHFRWQQFAYNFYGLRFYDGFLSTCLWLAVYFLALPRENGSFGHIWVIANASMDWDLRAILSLKRNMYAYYIKI